MEANVRVLGLDTSAKTGSVALCDDDRLIVEITLDMNRTHSERLMSALDAMLSATGCAIESVELVAVSYGPGPFTGVRIGVTTAKALAFGLGIPAVGVPTTDAIAVRQRHRAGDVCVLLDARKSEVYAARYASCGDGEVKRVGEVRCVPLSDVVADVCRHTLFVGDGVEPNRVQIAACLGELALFGDADAGICRASDVARLGWRSYDASVEPAESAHRLAPLYIRRSEAESKRDVSDADA
jgi:tRNA threonylcarbamoyladenosine biosynthesis protein TsaB